MGVLYVLEQGATVHRLHERLVVRKERRDLVEVPLIHVELVALFGGVNLTAAATALMLDRRIPVAYCTQAGRLRGFLQPAADRWGTGRIAQCRQLDRAQWNLDMAKALVGAKLRNQRTAIRRLNRRDRVPGADVADRLSARLVDASSATTVDELRGIEGAGASAYFSVIRQALTPLTTGPRQRRAPDPGGALLNLAYGLLSVDVLRATQLAGLDPAIGCYHRPRVGRFDLVLDLMEEWRPTLADTTAVTAVGRGVIAVSDFTVAVSGETRLTNKALRRFVGEYHRRIETEVAACPGGRPRPYREWVDHQARRYASAVRDGRADYEGFAVR